MFFLLLLLEALMFHFYVLSSASLGVYLEDSAGQWTDKGYSIIIGPSCKQLIARIHMRYMFSVALLHYFVSLTTDNSHWVDQSEFSGMFVSGRDLLSTDKDGRAKCEDGGKTAFALKCRQALYCTKAPDIFKLSSNGLGKTNTYTKKKKRRRRRRKKQHWKEKIRSKVLSVSFNWLVGG